MVLQPYARKGLTSDELLPFTWDKESKPTRKVEAEPVSKEEALWRFEEVLEMVGKG